jgi:5-methyltetrahydrofolate--homocysteine methyltransferase
VNALEELFLAIVEAKQAGEELARKALEQGATAADILDQAVGPAMTVVGERMEAGEYFVPDVLLAARVAQQATRVLEPLLREGGGAKRVGTVVLGTIEGDLHSIGKDLVKMLLETGGFEVIDLGINVPPQRFAAAAVENKADIVAISALLTTTMPTMGTAIEELVEAGCRDRVKVLVGGAPVTQDYADMIGADGYGSSAAAGARIAQSWVSGGS